MTIKDTGNLSRLSADELSWNILIAVGFVMRNT